MSTTLVDYLSDDILAEILIFNDYSSAYQFCHFVSKSLRERIQRSSSKSTLHLVWKFMYDRQHFAPVEKKLLVGSGQVNYLTEIQNRRRLLFNLLQVNKFKRKNNKNKLRPYCCFNLPNRCFFFKPIIPNDFDTEDEDENGSEYVLDPPPVVYECDSFVLTSCATSPEMVILDPFDGRLSVIPDITAHCVASDEALVEQAMFKAADAILMVPGSRDFTDWKDTEIAGHCLEESIVRNNHLRHHRHPGNPPTQDLWTQDDIFSLDVSSYFPDGDRGNVPGVAANEFDLINQGVDSKPIFDLHTNQLTGFMVGLGRTVTRVEDVSAGCTELALWTRLLDASRFEERLVCRYPWSVGYLDFDPIHRRVFANKSHGPEGPSYGAETVVVYPMIPWEGEKTNYFPSPLGILQCRHTVVILVVDSYGQKLLLGTGGGTIEIWDVSDSHGRSESKGWIYKRLFELNVVGNLRMSIDEWIADRVRVLKKMVATSSSYQTTKSSGDDNDLFDPFRTAEEIMNCLTEEEAISFKVLKRQPDLPVFQNGVDFIFLPKHLSIEDGGMVTLQYHRVEGSSLLFWRKHNDEFKIVTLINLRLSPRQKPRIHYDGNRLIVFGQDHIGVIILVYHVANGDNELPLEDASITGEHSGGVYNLTHPPQIRFANRVRHAALGGIERLDTIHMTANERFIVVNTKTGNLLGESSSFFSEGLLVIDLQDNCAPL